MKKQRKHNLEMYSPINDEDNNHILCLTMQVKYLIYIQITTFILFLIFVISVYMGFEKLTNNKDIEGLLDLFGAVKLSDVNYLISRIKKDDFLEFFQVVELCIENKCVNYLNN